MAAELRAVQHVVVGKPRLYGAHRRAIAAELAAEHDGVVHRLELARLGIDRHGIRNEIEAGRWFRAGRHTVAIGSPTLGGFAQLWRAVWESGSGSRLDGVSTLIASGIKGFTPRSIDVTLPARNRRHEVAGVRLHRVRQPPPALAVGIPRVGLEIGTIHGAQWAASDRQAALIICLPIQQRLVSAPRLGLAWRGLTRSPRRAFLDTVIADVTDGAHSLGELDFARMARKVGLPEPDRQSLCKGPDGRVYLDVRWKDVGMVVEIDGGHHALALNSVDDALRQNERVVEGERVLRMPVLGLRLESRKFMEQARRMYAVLSRDRH